MLVLPLAICGGKKKSRKKELDETDLNNSTNKKENLSKSDPENEDRIQNDISDNPTKEKNINIVKEKRRKKREDKDKNEEKKVSRKSKEKNKKVEFDQNRTKQESTEVVGVFIHECEVLGEIEMFIKSLSLKSLKSANDVSLSV